MDRYVVKVVDPKSCFIQVMDLLKGGSIEISEENKDVLFEIAKSLEITELYECIMSLYPEQLTVANVLTHLTLKANMQLPNSNEVDFVAANILSFDKAELAKLPNTVMCEILSSDALPKDKHEEIYFLVESATKANPSCFSLFEKVSFEHLRVETMSRFISLCDNMKGCISLYSGVWRALCKRLLLDVSEGGAQLPIPDEKPSVKISMTNDSFPLEGILHYLTQKGNGNVHKTGLVKVTSSSHYSIRHPYKIVDFTQDEYFYSNDAKNQWLQYEFNGYIITPESYTLKTRTYGGGYHIMSWAIMGSNDGENWSEIDRRENVTEMNDEGVVKSFKVTNPMSCKFVRICQTGPNSLGTDVMTLARFELFGAVQEDK